MKDFGGTDLMMNMVGTLVVMLAVFMPLVQLEQLTHLDNSTPEVSGARKQADNLEVALVEISLAQDGSSPVFRWRSSGGGAKTQSLNGYADLKERLDRDRPDAIRLRMDRGVLSGVLQDLVVDTSQLGIAIYQSNRKGQ